MCLPSRLFNPQFTPASLQNRHESNPGGLNLPSHTLKGCGTLGHGREQLLPFCFQFTI